MEREQTKQPDDSELAFKKKTLDFWIHMERLTRDAALESYRDSNRRYVKLVEERKELETEHPTATEG